MADFETHPVGTAARIEALELEFSVHNEALANVRRELITRDARIAELESERDTLRKAYATYRHAVQSAFNPGCVCPTCALVRGEAIAEMSDE